MESKNENPVVNGGTTSTTEMTGYVDFNRVNFDIPATVASYGEDVISKVDVLVNSIASMLKKDDALDPEFERRLAELPNFAKYLETSEGEKSKLALAINKSANATGIEALFNRIFAQRNSKKIPSYYDIYETYKGNGEYITAAIDRKKENALIDNKAFSAFSRELTLYIAKLEQLVSTGYSDKEEYVKTVIAALEQKCAETKDDALTRELGIKKKLVEIYERRLFALKNHLELMAISKTQIELQQATNLELIIQYDEFVKTVSKSLAIQSVVMVQTTKHKEELSNLARVSESVNLSLESNAKTIVDNLVVATERAKDGIIKADTLTNLYTEIEKGITVYNDGVKTAKAVREENVRKLDVLEKNMAKLKSGMPIESPEGITDAFESNGYSRTFKPKQPTPQKGGLLGRFGK